MNFNRRLVRQLECQTMHEQQTQAREILMFLKGFLSQILIRVTSSEMEEIRTRILEQLDSALFETHQLLPHQHERIIGLAWSLPEHVRDQVWALLAKCIQLQKIGEVNEAFLELLNKREPQGKAGRLL